MSELLSCFTGMEESKELSAAYGTFSEGAYVPAVGMFEAISGGEALYCLGFMYLNGLGVIRDARKALSLFEKSAAEGYLPAVSESAQCYAYGIGTKTDDARAAELFTKASEEGDPYAMGMLSLMYHNGDGVRRDHKKADQLLESCENAMVLDELEDEAYSLILEGNAILGRMLLMRAALMGSPVAAKALSLMYSHGEGVRADEEESSDWEATADDNGWEDADPEDLGDMLSWFSRYIVFDDDE